jgi:hypothetical protein
VNRFPHHTVDKLRVLSREDFQRALGVLAQFELQDDQLVRVDAAENWRSPAGIRQRDGGVQIGLTEAEIGDIWQRLGYFLEQVDQGRLTVF